MNPDGGSTVSQSAFPAAFAQAVCSRIFACCTLAEAKELLSPEVTDEASCRTIQARVAGYWSMTLNTSRARFDEQAAAQCVAFAQGVDCSAFSLSQPPGSEVCNQLVVGLQASGSACASSQECSGRNCTGIGLDSEGEPMGDGLCQTPAQQGQTCAISTDPEKFNDGIPCAPGSFESWSGGVCRCEALLANSQPCENDSNCSSGYCNNSSRCADPSTAPAACTAMAPP